MCTEWALKSAHDAIEDVLVSWDLQDINKAIILEVIKKETQTVNTQEHSLDNHAQSVGLIGLWSNPTIIDIKNIIKKDLSIQDHKALLMVYQLMFIQLDTTKSIHDFLNWWQEIWTTDVSSQELAWSKEDPIGDSKRLQMIASGLWPLQQRGKLTIDLTTKRAQLVAMDLAVSQKIPLDNAIQQVQQGTSKMKLKWSRMLKEYDKWLHNPVAMARTVLMVNTKDKSVE